jgi:DNA gyrase subunit A
MGLLKKQFYQLMESLEKAVFMIEIRDKDKLIEARITNGEHDILVGTREGKSIRFSENNVRASGRKTMGVRGIRLSSKDDFVVGMLVVKREGTILVATEKGYGKRTDIIQYRTQTRGGKGVLTMRCTEKTGKMVKIMEVVDSDDLIVITDAGVLMRQPIEAIRTIGRVTQGVRLVKLDKDSLISSVTRVMKEDEKEDKVESPPEENTIN